MDLMEGSCSDGAYEMNLPNLLYAEACSGRLCSGRIVLYLEESGLSGELPAGIPQLRGNKRMIWSFVMERAMNMNQVRTYLNSPGCVGMASR